MRSTKTKWQSRSDRICTFVVNNRNVEQRSDLAAEIRQGIKQGDVVILHPTEQIKTGDRVSPR